MGKQHGARPNRAAIKSDYWFGDWLRIPSACLSLPAPAELAIERPGLSFGADFSPPRPSLVHWRFAIQCPLRQSFRHPNGGPDIIVFTF